MASIRLDLPSINMINIYQFAPNLKVDLSFVFLENVCLKAGDRITWKKSIFYQYVVVSLICLLPKVIQMQAGQWFDSCKWMFQDLRYPVSLAKLQNVAFI